MGLHEIASRIILTEEDEKERASALFKQAIADIRRLIEQGADVNALEYGKTPLATLFDHNEVHVRHIFQPHIMRNLSTLVLFASIELIKAGACPWTGDPSAWDQATTYSPKDLLMNRLRYGKDEKGPGGESDLHAFCKRYPDYNIQILKLYRCNFSNIEPDRLNHVNDAGHTALHLLWEREIADEIEKNALLHFTYQILRAGGRIDIAGPDGTCVADIIIQDKAWVQMAMKDKDYRAEMGHIASICDQMQLQQNTAHALNAPSARRRSL